MLKQILQTCCLTLEIEVTVKSYFYQIINNIDMMICSTGKVETNNMTHRYIHVKFETKINDTYIKYVDSYEQALRYINKHRDVEVIFIAQPDSLTEIECGKLFDSGYQIYEIIDHFDPNYLTHIAKYLYYFDEIKVKTLNIYGKYEANNHQLTDEDIYICHELLNLIDSNYPGNKLQYIPSRLLRNAKVLLGHCLGLCEIIN